MKSLSVVLKTVERCNIDCKYCYFFNSADQSYKLNPPYIQKKTIRDIITFLYQGCIDLDISHLSIGFHGGEPLMQKKTDFQEMCQEFLQSLSAIADVEFTLQTNAMLVDEDWIKLFDQYNVGVSVSIDGPREYNDIARLDKRGKSTFDKTALGIKRLNSHTLIKKRGGVGLLCVINPTFDAKKIYRFFVDELHIKHIDFLLPDITFDAVLPYPVEAFSEYMRNVLEEWLNDDDPSIHVRFIESTINTLLGRSPSVYGAGGINNNVNVIQLPFISITSAGQLGPVDELRCCSVKLSPPYFIDHGIKLIDFFNNPVFTKIKEAQTNLPTKCKSCVWQRACHGGSLVNRFSEKNLFNNPSIYCEALKTLYADVSVALIKYGVLKADIIKNLI